MNDAAQTVTREPYEDDEIDLRELVRVLWGGKWIIGAFTVVAAVASVAFALMLPDVYRAEALLAPNDQNAGGGLSALASRYGDLASLAGFDLGGEAGDRTAMGLEVLRSRKFLSEFVARHDILVPLIAAQDWDPETGRLVIDAEVYDVSAGKWVREVDPPRQVVPSPQEAYERFMEILSVNQDKKTGFVRVAVEHYSPALARQWVDLLIADLNDTVMRQDVADAEQAIAYLNEQISRTSLTGLQAVFFSLIEEQTKTIMLARVSSEYLLRTIDPAVVPEEKARPTRSVIAIAGTLLGGFLGLIAVFIRNGLRK